MNDAASDDESLDGILQNDTPGQVRGYGAHHGHGNRDRHRYGSAYGQQLSARLRAAPHALSPSSLAVDTSSPMLNRHTATDRNTVRNEASKFIEIVEALMELSTLLSEDRRDAINEASRIRSSVRELEELFDARSEREAQYLSQVHHQQNGRFEKKYRNLCTRARQHMGEMQMHAAQYHAKTLKQVTRAQHVQDEYAHLNRVMLSQKEELETLRESTKHRVSERAYTDLRIKVLRLQEENSKVQMEKSKLQERVDALFQQVGKHGNPKDTLLSTLYDLGRSDLSDAQAAAEHQMQVNRINELQEAITRAEQVKLAKSAEFETQKDTLESEAKQLQLYAMYLVETLEAQEPRN